MLLDHHDVFLALPNPNYFDAKIYYEVKAQKGLLSFGECYGFEQLLAPEGCKKVSNIKIVKALEYLDIIGQTVGQID